MLEEQRLAELAGTLPAEEIGVVLEREFGIPRSRNAVKLRASRLGLSVWPRAWSMQELCHLFGVDSRTIEKWWIRPGLLRGSRWRPPRPGAARWAFAPADVEAFIRDHPWAYEWQRMQQQHPLAQLAETLHRADPWLTARDIARYFGWHPNNHHWLNRGLIPHQRRYAAPGSSDHGRIVVRASDLLRIAEAIAVARQHPSPPQLRGPSTPAPYLRAWRVQEGLRQADLAELAEVDVASISRLERGRTCRLDTVWRLASALGLEPADLLHKPPRARPAPRTAGRAAARQPATRLDHATATRLAEHAADRAQRLAAEAWLRTYDLARSLHFGQRDARQHADLAYQTTLEREPQTTGRPTRTPPPDRLPAPALSRAAVAWAT